MNFPIPVKLTVEEQPCQFNLTVSESDTHYDLGVDMNFILPRPVYSGGYIITPSDETQVLSTNGTILVEDVVINPIPQNYGLITWNGTSIVVS